MTLLLACACLVQQKKPSGLLAQQNRQVRLFESVESGDAAAVSKLLREGANPNAYESRGSYLGYPAPPLTMAVFKGRARIASLLLNAGANPNLRMPQRATSPKGPTPLMIAINVEGLGSNRYDIVKLLLSKKADTRLRDGMGRTAYDLAVLRKRENVAKLLAKYPH